MKLCLGMAVGIVVIVLAAAPAAQPRAGALAPAILSATVDPQGGLRFDYRSPDYCPSGYYDFLIVNDDGTTGSDGGLRAARNVTSFVCSSTSVRVERFESPGTYYVQARHWDANRLNYYYSNVMRVVVPAAGGTTSTTPPPTPPPTTSTSSDTSPPTVSAQISPGRKGSVARLYYTVKDDSGETRETITVGLADRTIWKLTTAFGEADGSRVYVNYRVPKTLPVGTFFFCVAAQDRAGNKSSTRCALIVVK